MEAAPKRLRAVFDCMVFLQAAVRGNSPAGICLRLSENRTIELCVSDEILHEIGDVLTRPRIRAKFSILTDAFVGDFLRTLRGTAAFFPGVPRKVVFPRDPKHEPYLNLALAAQANYLVSRDNDMLDLNAPYDPTGAKLRGGCPQLQIIEPEASVAVIRSRVAGR
jgi:putative PIN family toxin of toxin-antitoxin system